MPRPQVQDLRGEPTINATARPVDRFSYVHGQQLSLIDFQGLSRSLTQALNTYTNIYGDQENALGEAEFQKVYQNAKQENTDQAAAFRKAVASGGLAEAHNPFFVTGFRKAAARELATRYYGESQIAIAEGHAGTVTPNPTTGIPEAFNPAIEPICTPGSDKPG
jgi:hypothetical protein